MVKKIGFILIVTFLAGCRKIDINKSEKQLLGKWKLMELQIDGSDALSDFKQSKAYFDYLIFYPESQGNKLYYHNMKQNPFTGTWNFISYDTKSLDLTLQQDKTSLGLLPNFGPIPFGTWKVEKLNNNKLIIEYDPTTRSIVQENYKLSFKKIGNFE